MAPLLYIGIGGNPGRRFEQHAADKPWWSEVSRVKIEHFPDRPDALAAELDAIRKESPKCNLEGKPGILEKRMPTASSRRIGSATSLNRPCCPIRSLLHSS
ncbi:MAG: hypothetical protein ACRD1K_17545 [Acidimicrobiales bacterium]